MRSIAENAPSWMRRATWSLARPRVVQQFAELRALERVEAAGGAGVFLEDDRVLDAALVQDEVLPGGGLLVG
ncbi:hypothetical protein [Streptomyces pilosus]|uniref:hypothetical protein n=1 Tax=Streptomyces pilosus TaxID=28893 RepID=UPI001F2B320A|nr:hypothetical protein [Streptomyces pilosus]